MKRLVVINGTGGSGKDTFVTYVSKYAKVFNFSSIDKVKEIAKLIGWDGKKEEKDRKFLSDLKRLTTEYNDMAYNDMKEKIENFMESDDEIMFIHIREAEEIKRVKDEYNALTILIKREGYDNITTNDSDALVDNYDYDVIINNTSLEDLDRKAKTFALTLQNHYITRGK